MDLPSLQNIDESIEIKDIDLGSMNLTPRKDNTPPSSKNQDSVDNIHREEMLWTIKNEDFIHGWLKTLQQKVKAHNNSGVKFKRMYKYIGLPCAILPVILSTLTGILNQHMIVLNVLLILLGVLNATNAFINPSKKSQLHFEFESKYNGIISTINLELIKPKRLRMPCDVFLHTTSMNIGNLESNEPYIKEEPEKK